MITEAIVLAGGLGTRLREAVPDLPKCMAPVAGNPFLVYVIDALRMQGVQRIVFSLGYKAAVITDFLEAQYPTLDYETVVEEEPLGTGGAIQLALSKARTPNVLIVNGDTLFRINTWEIEKVQLAKNAECTVALKPMQNFDRYGVVTVASNDEITSFKEKQFYKEGLINGGVYLLNKEKFLQHEFPKKFSFEKDYLEPQAGKGKIFGTIQDGYFIDIGIPEDFKKANEDFNKPILNLHNVDKNWTLLLDRDGVINDERLGKYVLHWGEFNFSTGVLEAFKILSEKFRRILIISNQRGVTKGLMTEDDLLDIHNKMQKEVITAGGRIHNIYYCTDKENKSFYRKPNPGMALKAFADYKDIDPQKCIMVGNKPSDMRFGRAAGVYTVFLETTNPHEPHPHPDVDLRFTTLLEFAKALKS